MIHANDSFYSSQAQMNSFVIETVASATNTNVNTHHASKHQHLCDDNPMSYGFVTSEMPQSNTAWVLVYIFLIFLLQILFVLGAACAEVKKSRISNANVIKEYVVRCVGNNNIKVEATTFGHWYWYAVSIALDVLFFYSNRFAINRMPNT